MKDTISGKDLINKAKEYIDEGFSKMNREVKDPRLLGRYVLAATYKAIRLSDAIILLCKKNELFLELLPVAARFILAIILGR